MPEGELFLGLLVYLVLVSSIISIATEEDYMIDLGYGYDWLNTSQTDFTALSNLSQLNVVIPYGGWNITAAQGIYSTTYLDNKILFADINQIEGNYTNTYHLKNPQHRDWHIFIYDAPVGDITVRCDETGFWLMKSPSLHDEYHYSYVNANEIEDLNITTSWNIQTDRCTVYYGSTKLFDEQISQTFLDTFFDWVNISNYYAGVYAFNKNLQIHSIDTVFSYQVDDQEISFSSLLVTMGTILLWSLPGDIMPLWLNFLAIKIPLIMCGYVLYYALRGS